MYQTPLSRRTRRALGIVAAAALAVPISMIGGSANVVLASGSNPNTLPAFSPFAPPVPTTDGASGASPHDSGLSPALLHNAGNPQALLTAAGPMAEVPNGPLGIPGIVLQAYQQAQATLAQTDPSCNLPWWLLAGIGKIESNQAENGEVDAHGNTLRPILGPVLNGTNGSAAIAATAYSYQLTGDPTWERAVGPMQFLPSTWPKYGGSSNPSNVFDAALAAGRYLCNGGRDLSDPAQQAQAVFSYNHSNSYVAKVLLWANAYKLGVHPLPPSPVLVGAGPIDVPPPYNGGIPNSPTTPPSSSSTPPPSTPGSRSSTVPPTTTTGATTTTLTPVTKPPTTSPPTTTTTPPPSCTTPPTTTTTTTTPPPTTTTSPAPPPCAPPTSAKNSGSTGSTVTPTP
ncbi:MAG TPA: hypothetical protein VJ914_30965 [Pseudonocardiaceae bacterium]|nr:hypothetical protein [Pseudonocardiaceae bacterium]